jgi:hypothetical protein
MCYGIPVELLAKWDCVRATVAAKYKKGTIVPSPAALELFKLNLEGRIVPEEWRGFVFRGGLLWDPSNRSFSHGHLRAYQLGMQLLRAFACGFRTNASSG